MTRVKAIIQSNQIVKTRNGERLKLVCQGHKSGNIFSVWGAPDGSLSRLKAGDIAILAETPTGQYEVEQLPPQESDHSPAPAPANSQPVEQPLPPNTSLTPDQKRDIAAYIDQQVRIYAYCLGKVAAVKGISERDIRPISTTLYLTAKDKFDL